MEDSGKKIIVGAAVVAGVAAAAMAYNSINGSADETAASEQKQENQTQDELPASVQS